MEAILWISRTAGSAVVQCQDSNLEKEKDEETGPEEEGSKEAVEQERNQDNEASESEDKTEKEKEEN